MICGFYIPFGNVPKYQKKMTPWKMAASRWEVGNEQGASCGRQQASVHRVISKGQKRQLEEAPHPKHGTILASMRVQPNCI